MAKGDVIINPQLFPKTFNEDRLYHDLPPIIRAEGEERFYADQMRIAAAYHQVAPKYNLDDMCIIASAVNAYFLRHGLPPDFSHRVNARVMPFLYLWENPNCPLITRRRNAIIAGSMASILQTRRKLGNNPLNDIYGDDVLEDVVNSQSHFANVIPRRIDDGRGRFIYSDLTYFQFQRPGKEGKLQTAIVDAAKLRDEFLLLPLSLGENKAQNVIAAHLMSGEAFDMMQAMSPKNAADFERLRRESPILALMELDRSRVSLIQNEADTEITQKIIKEMTDVLSAR